jgi:hypothetical protein
MTRPKGYNRDSARRYRERVNAWLAATKAALGCADCGERDPRVLDFDHVRGVKSFSLGDTRFRCNPRRMLEEIMKCEVRCANCHRRVTRDRSKMK